MIKNYNLHQRGEILYYDLFTIIEMVIKCNYIQHNHIETCQNVLNAQELALFLTLAKGHNST